MEKLADKLTLYIISRGAIEESDYEIYHYGMLTGLEVALCLTICSVIAIFLKSFPEFVVVSIIFYSLRAYVGGLHFKSFIICSVCSCTVITFLLVIIHYTVLGKYMYLVGIIITLIMIATLSPIATKNNINDAVEKVVFAKQREHVLEGIAVVSVLFTLLNLLNFLSLVFYTTQVILISMILGIVKNLLQNMKSK